MLERFLRRDKWFLGGGGNALAACAFPRHLVAPGFWDPIQVADVTLPRGFTVFFRRSGRDLVLSSRVVDWRPDRLRLEHACSEVTILETRLVLGDSFVSVFRLPHGLKDAEVTVWRALPAAPTDGDAPQAWLEGDLWRVAWPPVVRPDRTGIEPERLKGEGEVVVRQELRLGMSVPGSFMHRVAFAQPHDLVPEPRCISGLIGAGGSVGAVRHDFWRGCPEGERFCVALSATLPDEAAPTLIEPEKASERGWRAYFAECSEFWSDDPFLTNTYWYRQYLLRLNRVRKLPGSGVGPFVAEGVGFFRNFITYSTQAVLRELQWQANDSLEQVFLSLRAVQRTDGSLPGHVYGGRPARDFYHADFSAGLRAVVRRRPEWSEEVRDFLGRYLDWLERARGTDRGITIHDQNETGQEYAPRYRAALSGRDDWSELLMIGAETTCYALAMHQLRAELEPQHLIVAANKQDELMALYDGPSAIFRDLIDGVPNPATSTTGLYPAAIESVARALGADECDRMVREWLENPDNYAIGRGFPSAERGDPEFSADGVWRGERRNCPWNGRSWPMANAHLIETLMTIARVSGRAQDAARVEDALSRCVRLMFADEDPLRPNAFEHYHPDTGEPSIYRGYDDYVHSWFGDLILRAARDGFLSGRHEALLKPTGDPASWVEVRG